MCAFPLVLLLLLLLRLLQRAIEQHRCEERQLSVLALVVTIRSLLLQRVVEVQQAVSEVRGVDSERL